MPEVACVGSGEACDPELPNTSLLYRGGRSLLIDCGYSVPHALWRLSRDPDLLDAVWISHQHADHSFGLPALLLWMRLHGRRRPLDVCGGPGVGDWLRRLLDLAYPGAWTGERCYPIVPCPLAPGEELALGPLRLTCARSDHPVRNLALRIEEAGRVFAYSGDGAPTPATRELFTGAHLLVHECFSLDEPVEGHARAPELVAMAGERGVERLALLHFGAPFKEELLAFVARHDGPVELLAPRPGEVMRLDRARRRG